MSKMMLMTDFNYSTKICHYINLNLQGTSSPFTFLLGLSKKEIFFLRFLWVWLFPCDVVGMLQLHHQKKKTRRCLTNCFSEKIYCKNLTKTSLLESLFKAAVYNFIKNFETLVSLCFFYEDFSENHIHRTPVNISYRIIPTFWAHTKF